MAKEAELDDLPSISSILTLPIDIVVRRVRNVREAELLLQISSTASNFETAVSAYEVLALKMEELKERWDALWLSNEPFLNPAIPLVGQAMSHQNVARGHVIQQIEDLVAALQQQAAALVQFADMHRSYARELRAEGLGKLAAEKLLLCDIEQELSSRITRVCSGGRLAGLRPLSDIVQQMEASLLASTEKAPMAVGQADAERHESAVKSGGHAVTSMVGRDSFMEEKERLKDADSEHLKETEPPSGKESAGHCGKRASQGGEEGIQSKGLSREGGATVRGESTLPALELAENAVGPTAELPVEKISLESGHFLGAGKEEMNRSSLGAGSRKRPREDDVEGGRGKAPRIEAEPGQVDASPAELPSNCDRVSQRSDIESSRPAPFSPNLAASFQLEERLEGKEPEEERPERKEPEEERPEGKAPEQERPEGEQPEEEGPEGKAAEEETPEGKAPEEERPDESGSREAPGSDEIDWGKVGDRRGGRQGNASAPACGIAEDGFRGTGSGGERGGSETERGREQDPSISSRERQLLTDEKLIPGSDSVSRGNLHFTQSPSEKGPGISTPGNNGGLLGWDERPTTDRGVPPRRLDAFVMSDGGPQRRPLSTGENTANESGAMQPPRTLPTLRHANDTLFNREAGGESESQFASQAKERAPESPLLQDPVPSGQEATPPEHSPGSQTQSLFQSQAGSQRTPGSNLSPGKSGRNDGPYGSPPGDIAFQLRLSNSSSSPSKSPGSEKLSQTGGGAFENGLRGQSQVLAHGHSRRAIPEGGTTELEAGTETLDQGGGAFQGESRGRSEGARRIAADVRRVGTEGGTTEAEGGRERSKGEAARVAGGTVEVTGGKGKVEDRTAQEIGATTVQSRILKMEGGTAEGGAGMVEAPSNAANGAAGGWESAALAGQQFVSETGNGLAAGGVEWTEGFVTRVPENDGASAVEKSGGTEALRTGERISGALSRGRNDPENLETHTPDGEARDEAVGGGALSLAEEAIGRHLSHTGVWARVAQSQETVPPAQKAPSLLGGETRVDVASAGAVPNSQEGGSQSSGRGVDPGPTPPSSSKSCSRDDQPERAGGALLKEGVPRGADRLTDNRASAAGGIGGGANSGDGAETASESRETELVPETEEMEEETEEQGCGQEKASFSCEPTLTASPCRASESPGMSGSQPLSQSQVF